MLEDNKQLKFWLEEFDSFQITGKDAKRFLNGITTTNINLDYECFKTCWLTPTGNLRAILEIHKDSKGLLIIVIQGNVEELKKYCEDMIFPSDDIAMSNISRVFRLQEANNSNSWRKVNVNIFNKKNLNSFISGKQFKIMDFEELTEWKIFQGLPIKNKEIDGKNNPIELGLTDLIDFNKGCYLGQETMARLKKVSSLQQELRLWTSLQIINQNVVHNSKIFLNTDKNIVVGKITSFQNHNFRNITGLAMMKKSYLKGYDSFFVEDVGEIKTMKSISSIFF